MKDEKQVPLIERWASEETPIRILSEGDGDFVGYDDLPEDDEEE